MKMHAKDSQQREWNQRNEHQSKPVSQRIEIDSILFKLACLLISRQ